MEKQVPNLQISFDFKSITPKSANLKNDLIAYNFLAENIQGFIRMEIFTQILHPLRKILLPKQNQNFIRHIEEGNFQMNLLQDSQHLSFRKFLEIQKLLFVIKSLNGTVASFNARHINLLAGITHLQAHHTYDLQDSQISLSKDLSDLPEKKALIIHHYLLSILLKILDSNSLPYFINSEFLVENNLSQVKDYYPELLELEFQEHSSTMLRNFYFNEHFKLTYH